MIIPTFLLEILSSYWDLVEQWLSKQYYERMVRQSPRHWLVQLQQRVNLDTIEQQCQGYHHSSGPGAKPSQPVRYLVRGLLVKYLYNLSLRETEERMNNDLMVKWFVGYELFATAMDHSSLERFEQWVEHHQHRLYFDTVLEQILLDFPAEHEAVQIGDTFAMQANAAREGLISSLRHTAGILLRELEQADPTQSAGWLQGWNAQALFGHPGERNLFYLGELERHARLVQTVQGALALVACVRPYLSNLPAELQPRLRLRLEDIDKIIDDALTVERDEQGQVQEAHPLPVGKRGQYQLVSATDREATMRHHGGNSTLGYNIGLAITPSGVIFEIQSATGAEPDQSSPAALIQQQRQALGTCPPKLIYDQAAGAGRTRADVARVSQGQTQLVAKIPPSAYPGRFSPYEFRLDVTGMRLTCPHQQTTDTVQYDVDHRGRTFTFSFKRHCHDCPLWTQCRSAKAKPDAVRTVYISYDHEYIRQALTYNQSAAFQLEMKLRPLVERIIFMLTNYDGARHARRRGKHWADFQAKMCAMARNLRTWLRKLERQHPTIAPLLVVG